MTSISLSNMPEKVAERVLKIHLTFGKLCFLLSLFLCWHSFKSFHIPHYAIWRYFNPCLSFKILCQGLENSILYSWSKRKRWVLCLALKKKIRKSPFSLLPWNHIVWMILIHFQWIKQLITDSHLPENDIYVWCDYKGPEWWWLEDFKLNFKVGLTWENAAEVVFFRDACFLAGLFHPMGLFQ